MRSDTVTQPTASMRYAMATAEVGDDVFEDDPTVQLLEAEMAQVAGKQAALFVPSGTMANLIAVMVHCEVRGSEVILGADSHIHIYEQGGIATVGGVHPRALPNEADGSIDLAAVAAAVRPADVHFPTSRLLVLENTHNKCGGRVLSVEYMRAARALCDTHALQLHVDGARVFNAAAALGVPVAEVLAPAHTAALCLSKGLGAPAGSVIVGPAPFIARARRVRKVLGGGMRQVGCLAAAARVALQETPSKLVDDNRRARELAQALAATAPLAVDVATVQSNLVYIHTGALPAAAVAAAVGEQGVRVLAVGPHTIRACCHHQIDDGRLRIAIDAFRHAVQQLQT